LYIKYFYVRKIKADFFIKKKKMLEGTFSSLEIKYIIDINIYSKKGAVVEIKGTL